MIEDKDPNEQEDKDGVPPPPVPDAAWGRSFDIDKGKTGVSRVVSKHAAEAASIKEAAMKIITSPQRPSQREVDKHIMSGHVTYAPWCECFVRGRANDDAHRTPPEEPAPREFPVISMDWCRLGQKGDAKCLPVLAVKDSASGSVFAHGAPGMAIATGEYGEHTIKAVVGDVDSLGYKRILLKSDQQPSIKVLQQHVKEVWTGEVVKQNSPVASSQSNGRAEKAIRDLEGHLRTLKLALDSRLGACVPTDAPVILWLVEHSADFISRFRVGRDGKTARERIIGKQDLPNVAEFGESVFYLPLDRDRGQTEELDPKLQVGVWLGLERSTNEAKIGTPSGVLRARTVRRRP